MVGSIQLGTFDKSEHLRHRNFLQDKAIEHQGFKDQGNRSLRDIFLKMKKDLSCCKSYQVGM
jgi:hypothetical protein